MREELRRNNSIGNYSGICLLQNKIFDDKIISIDALKNIDRFRTDIEINLHVAISFYEYLGYITIVNKKKIALTPLGIVLSHMDTSGRNVAIGKLIFEKIIDELLLNINMIHVDSETGKIYIDENAFALSSAIFRNYLITTKCLRIINSKYILCDEIEKSVSKFLSTSRNKITQSMLLRRLQKEADDGARAEVLALEYEFARLPDKRERIKQISLIDVTAGYDILSFDSDSSTNYDRFIEVKSFHGAEHFYWSINERRIAELYRNKYFIYLIDLDEFARDPATYKPIILQDPINTINNDKWLIEPVSFLVSKIEK